MYAAHSKIGSMSKRLISEMLILVVGLCLWSLPAKAADDPVAVVKTGTEQVRKILQEYPQANKERRDKVRAVIDGYFDFDAISRLAVGMPWRNLPPEKQQEFTQQFTKLLFNTYVGDIEKYAQQDITYRNRQIYQGYVVVEANAGGQSIDYYLHQINGNWKVYDVGVGGVSLVTNYRDQFDPILTRGSFDQLSAVLKRKIDKVCALDRC